MSNHESSVYIVPADSMEPEFRVRSFNTRIMDDKLNTKLNTSLSKSITRVRQKDRWESLQSHLDQALNQWNEISIQMKDELSPDQKRLQEVKQLLNQLKVKLEEF